jgi:hypothetical protein
MEQLKSETALIKASTAGRKRRKPLPAGEFVV